MPLFSAFTPLGALAFSSGPPHGEVVYESMARNLNGTFDMTPGTHAEASTYARSRSIARGMYATDRAKNQTEPLKCIEMLPGLERDYGIVPNANDTILQRQQAIAARQLASLGASLLNVESSLRTLLGSDFVTVRPYSAADRTLSASTPSGNFTPIDQPPKVISILDPVPIGTATVRYTTADPIALPVTLLVNDSVAIQPGNSGLVEIVTVSAVGAGTFTATFAKGHDTNCVATTGNFPNWWSTQCHLLVVVSAAASLDAEKTRKVHDLMQRTVRGVYTWNVVAPSGAGTLGPFTLGDANLGQLGTVPIGTLSYTTP